MNKQFSLSKGNSRTVKGGFTLVELIVSLAIASILIALAGSLIVFGMNFLNRTEIRATDKHLAETSADYLKERLLFARSITVVRANEPPRSAQGGEVLFIGQADPVTGKVVIANEGHLYYLRMGETVPIDVFGSESYEGNSLALDYRALVDEAMRTNKVFEINTKTIRNGMVAYTSKKTFNLYEADGGETAEPRASVSIDSWSDGVGFDASMAKFYLLINPQSPGYVTTGLIAQFDAINNDVSAQSGYQSGNAYHNPNQRSVWSDLSGNNNNMQLTFTSNTTPIRDSSIYFDGSGDFGRIPNLNLSAYSVVTVEVYFREATTTSSMMLFEYSTDWNSQNTGFGVCLNSLSVVYSSTGTVHTNFHWNNEDGTTGAYPINYSWVNQSVNFTTHTNVYDMTQGGTQRKAYIDGAAVGLIKTTTATTPQASAVNTRATTLFTPQPFFVASRNGSSIFFAGEISSIRIYNRPLTADEVSQNAQEDYLRFGQ